MVGSLAPGTFIAREGGRGLSWVIDDDSGRWREDLAAKTGVSPWAPYKLNAKLIVLYNAVKVYVGPSKRDYMPIDRRGPIDPPRDVPTTVEHSG